MTAPVAPLPLLEIPNAECINDFLVYVTSDAVRQRVIACFNEVVQPLIRGGGRVEVISHSWGTVVAYEALRLMDGTGETFPTCSVLNLFTVGSALSIPAVKRRLLSAAIDGRRPRLVRTWVNVNALWDVVGGPLNGEPFEVDAEYLNVPPVGCAVLLPQTVCAHFSYFRKANTLVNRDIFARHIER
jgi:hypothetical protein